jgi:class 3 adenylate cyclase
MAQTEARPGFRLPWTADNDAAPETGEATTAESPVADATPVADEPTIAEEQVTPDMTDLSVSTARRPTKFMADLSRAMQTAVETSRDDTMARLTADAKVVVEEIHTASAAEAADLRRRADDDVAAVREWSKAEIARIREEAEARITLRKGALDGEMDAHAAVVETRVKRVGDTVTEFEGVMAAFFEEMRSEEDPTRIAAMAETMPEPPDLAGIAASISEPDVASFDPIRNVEPVAETEAPTAEAATAESTDPATEAATDESTEEGTEPDPRIGLDFAAAEAEAATFSGDLDEDETLPAPAADLETGETIEAPAEAASTDRGTTRVVVLGLVSVASIATFKRSLGRVPGVSAIGVSSGPDGEFVFTVSHDTGLGLAAAITELPGFDARITTETADGLEVTAHDPDTGN